MSAHASTTSTSGTPPDGALEHIHIPSDTELRLTKRVIDLEHERDVLAVRVKTLEARYPSHGGSVDSPRTDEDGASFSSAAGAPIPVPPELLPVLAVLRQHIGELTRENAALRYTFLGARADLASSSRVTLDAMLTPGSSAANTPIPTDSPHSPPIGIEVTPPADPAPPPVGLGLTPIIPQVPIPTMSVGTVVPAVVVPPAAAGSKDVDLYAVVERVRTLMLENEELGDMVAEAGAADGDQWVQTLEDTKAVIASLESDLTHNLAVVESLRAEVNAYKSTYGKLDSGKSTPQRSGADSTPRGGGGGGYRRGGGDRGGERGTPGSIRNERRRNGSDRFQPDRSGRDSRGGGGGQGEREAWSPRHDERRGPAARRDDPKSSTASPAGTPGREPAKRDDRRRR